MLESPHGGGSAGVVRWFARTRQAIHPFTRSLDSLHLTLSPLSSLLSFLFSLFQSSRLLRLSFSLTLSLFSCLLLSIPSLSIRTNHNSNYIAGFTSHSTKFVCNRHRGLDDIPHSAVRIGTCVLNKRITGESGIEYLSRNSIWLNLISERFRILLN